jgi:hypothetical protein
VTAANTQTPESDRVRLRAIVATIEQEISHLAKPATTESKLIVSWSQLVNLLGLGAAPAVRQCPVCRQIGMRAATRCGFCWTKLLPLPDGDTDPSQPRPAV